MTRIRQAVTECKTSDNGIPYMVGNSRFDPTYCVLLVPNSYSVTTCRQIFTDFFIRVNPLVGNIATIILQDIVKLANHAFLNRLASFLLLKFPKSMSNLATALIAMQRSPFLSVYSTVTLLARFLG